MEKFRVEGPLVVAFVFFTGGFIGGARGSESVPVHVSIQSPVETELTQIAKSVNDGMDVEVAESELRRIRQKLSALQIPTGIQEIIDADLVAVQKLAYAKRVDELQMQINRQIRQGQIASVRALGRQQDVAMRNAGWTEEEIGWHRNEDRLLLLEYALDKAEGLIQQGQNMAESDRQRIWDLANEAGLGTQRERAKVLFPELAQKSVKSHPSLSNKVGVTFSRLKRGVQKSFTTAATQLAKHKKGPRAARVAH